MDAAMDDDPFSWDVASVARRLTASGSLCSQNRAILVNKIYEHEFDGQTLLKYEHYCSRQGLMECLGIRLARHQVALGETLLDLRSRSWAYQKWRQDFDKKQAGCLLEADENEVSSSLSPKSPHDLPAQSTELGPLMPPQQELSARAISVEVGAPDSAYQSPPTVQLSHQDDDVPIGGELHFPEESSIATAPNLPVPPRRSESADVTKHTLESDNLEPERPTKRKRIAPLVLADRPLNIAHAFIPTEADTLSFAPEGQTEDQEFVWDNAPIGAYLGDGSLSLETIKSPTGSLSSRLLEPSEDSFATLVPNAIPPGRQITVHRAMKRFLKKNSRIEKLEKQGFVQMRSPSPGESESILDLVDLPDFFDEQTIREMEEEKAEREKAKADMARLSLSLETVKEILNDAIEAISFAWEERKLPKHQRKAHRLWHDARRRGTKKVQILMAHKQAKFFDDRIKRLCKEISDETWTKPSDLRNQANCLEQSVQDKLYNIWLVGMLESRIAPPKPDVVPRPRKPIANKASDNLGEEILTSSDEEDFVVPDDQPEIDAQLKADLPDAMEMSDELPASLHSPAQSVKAELPDLVDLTQATWGPNTPTGLKSTSFVDLTSPAKSQAYSEPFSQKAAQSLNDDGAESPSGPKIKLPVPTPEEFGNFKEIGSKSPTHWAKKHDRWKLLICLIWQLPHNRRAALIDFLRDRSEDDAWEEGVMAHMNNPLASIDHLEDVPKVISFDVTRLFLCFVRTKNYQEHLPILIHLSPKIRKKLTKSKRPSFHLFWAFIRDAASDFPQDSQIYNADAFDDVLDDEIDDDDLLLEEEEEENSQLRSQKPAKEIIQNKEAVDLRERERMRVREQKARRDKLRNELSLLGSIPRDRARLIVNETKQDDQPFIYVNADIGTRIKDHQVEGVRFMWNQLVLDAETRQGCLLAHTMGLGKTMQVITLLVVIQEAAMSSDPRVRAQIPEHLRTSQTLVVCPPGLVDNWVDELLMWAPDGILGEFRRLDAKMNFAERPEVVRQWAEGGGVLVIGYHMLSHMLSRYPEVESLLLDKPSIVVADEAHQMKNSSGRANKSCSRFKTKNRIALTGSPLANNVEEYHSMIDWVAPNFLGPVEEFREIYAQPIQHGLWRDSSSVQKRKALKTLEALKMTVAPKVNRATIKSCLKEDLPPKFEFVLFVPPTPTQSRLYDLYVQSMIHGSKTAPKSWILAMTNDLGLICSHPRCFGQKIKDITGPHPKEDAESRIFPRSIIPLALKELKIPDPDSTSLSWKVELLNIILDEARSVGDKVLIFSQSLVTINYLHNHFQMQKRRVSCLVGSTGIDVRQEMTKHFNNGDQEVYLISTTAGGVGLNIHGANRVVIFDFKWNPVYEQQAIGRAYRIGQKKPVYVYTLVVAGSFEEDIHNRHVFKSQLASRVVDEKNPLSWSNRNAIIMHNIKETKPKDLDPFLGKDHVLDKLIQYKKDSQSIRYIISTDTFEEEDPDVTLTEVERRDVDSMVELNRLRLKDPAAFLKAKQRVDQQEFHRLSQQSHALHSPVGLQGPSAQPPPLHLQHPGVKLRLNPTKPQPPVNQSPGGTGDGSWTHRHPPAGPASQPASHSPGLASQTQPPQPSFGPAPLPVAGANTYFGTHPHVTPFATQPPAPAAIPAPAPTPMQMPKTPTPGPTPTTSSSSSNIFGQPQNHAKFGFQFGLESRIHVLRVQGLLRVTGETRHIAHVLTDAIDVVRKDIGRGFLPDNQHWKDLERLLVHDQFIMSLALGSWTPEYVARADKQELESRVKATSGLQGQVIFDQASRKTFSPDPHVGHLQEYD
ncbi:hypothetical protein B0T10DRAFT_573335 [Thelonectria olida]|uniref:Uncharacterized protein n=1 Tax=Thelonectria olida TaxID=1576542 RepID=A0A9P8W3L8_9HYPO|nr:hypothetical protein B0T10DRAFT_573335 [Thelonectria olida]